MYSLVFFVPKSHKKKVKKALFEKGAGKYKKYDKCCWETKGTGQFRPLKNSTPYIGTQEKLEKVEEYRIEMLCPEDKKEEIIKTLKNNHPYEEVAFYLFKNYI